MNTKDLRDRIFADGKVDREEINLLLAEKSERHAQNVQDEEFNELFKEASVKHFAEDGKLDDEEADFIIANYPVECPCCKAVVKAIAEACTEVSEKLTKHYNL